MYESNVVACKVPATKFLYPMFWLDSIQQNRCSIRHNNPLNCLKGISGKQTYLFILIYLIPMEQVMKYLKI